MYRNMLNSIMLAFFIYASFSVSAETNMRADIVYRNGNIYTADEKQPVVDYFAIKSGKFIAVGNNKNVKSYIGPETEIIDLNGKTVIPGIHDAHIHLLASQLKLGDFNCSLPENAISVDSIIISLRECEASDRPRPGNWLIGGYIENQLLESRAMREKLNVAFPEVPVLLSDYSNHNVLANRKALELAKVSADTNTPRGGTIDRDSNGEPTGLLVETAVRLVYRVIPEYDEMDYLMAVKNAVRIANRYGITSVQEASAVPGLLKALKKLDDMGELSLHVAAHMVIDNEKFAPNDAISKAFKQRALYASKHVDVNNVKLWLDGQPLEPFPTHATLDHISGEIDEALLHFDQNFMNKTVLEFDRQGIKVKLHAVGDGAVRSALDAVAFAREHNPDGINHDIAHCNFINSADMERFFQLDVTAELSPAIWHLDIPELENASPFGPLIESGANVTIGSDWLLTPNPNLFPAIESVVVERGIDMSTLLKSMTINGAKAVGKENQWGSIEAGKSADFVVLDQDPLAVEPKLINNTNVIMTVFEGRAVYQGVQAGFN